MACNVLVLEALNSFRGGPQDQGERVQEKEVERGHGLDLHCA